jgi:hypothetical protein
VLGPHGCNSRNRFGEKEMLKALLVGVTLAGLVALGRTVEAATPTDFTAKCLLQVMGKNYIDGLCDVSILDADGSFTITERVRRPYFAYVLIDSKDKLAADGSWNRVRASDHAHATLGVLRFHDGCWSNDNAKICWSKKA